MSILVYAESAEGKFKKSAFEAISYGSKLAENLGLNLTTLCINASEPESLALYGAKKVVQYNDDSLSNFNAEVYASLIEQVVKAENANIVIIDATSNGLYMAPMIAANLNAGYASNVVALPNSTAPFTVKRKAFSNKAFNLTQIHTDIKVIGLAKNSFGIIENQEVANIVSFDATLLDSNMQSESVEQTTGKITIADADIVISGGRGLKGPENWGMIEELASLLGAATSCSKPVSDLGWRPHSEHVGQTGKPVSANLYIAIGISGAIQHLAGVNSSKIKVVINTDPEAPFFKAADYGIVGDAFEVVPKLIEKIKEFKSNNA
jgi:electron transfer flavoprotein alpha subunit